MSVLSYLEESVLPFAPSYIVICGYTTIKKKASCSLKRLRKWAREMAASCTFWNLQGYWRRECSCSCWITKCKERKKERGPLEILKEWVESRNQIIRENRWHVHLALGSHPSSDLKPYEVNRRLFAVTNGFWIWP